MVYKMAYRILFCPLMKGVLISYEYGNWYSLTIGFLSSSLELFDVVSHCLILKAI